jgi:16S rRNA processing protein RimM
LAPPLRERATTHPKGLEPTPGEGIADHEVELGYVSGVFGVHGEVRLFLHNEDSDTLFHARKVVLVRPDGARFRATLSARSGAGKRILGTIRHLDDRELAATLKDWLIVIPTADLPPPEPGEYYVWQLEGLDAVVRDRVVGCITRVHDNPGGSILEIAGKGEPSFVLANERFVLSVDLPGRRVVLAEDALDDG